MSTNERQNLFTIFHSYPHLLFALSVIWRISTALYCISQPRPIVSFFFSKQSMPPTVDTRGSPFLLPPISSIRSLFSRVEVCPSLFNRPVPVPSAVACAGGETAACRVAETHHPTARAVGIQTAKANGNNSRLASRPRSLTKGRCIKCLVTHSWGG